VFLLWYVGTCNLTEHRRQCRLRIVVFSHKRWKQGHGRASASLFFSFPEAVSAAIPCVKCSSAGRSFAAKNSKNSQRQLYRVWRRYGPHAPCNGVATSRQAPKRRHPAALQTGAL